MRDSVKLAGAATGVIDWRVLAWPVQQTAGFSPADVEVQRTHHLSLSLQLPYPLVPSFSLLSFILYSLLTPSLPPSLRPPPSLPPTSLQADTLNRALVSAIMRQLGVAIDLVDNAVDATSMAERGNYDLVLIVRALD